VRKSGFSLTDLGSQRLVECFHHTSTGQVLAKKSWDILKVNNGVFVSGLVVMELNPGERQK
jgi:hypothetical protein